MLTALSAISRMQALVIPALWYEGPKSAVPSEERIACRRMSRLGRVEACPRIRC
jgi:hypothetical protein